MCSISISAALQWYENYTGKYFSGPRTWSRQEGLLSCLFNVLQPFQNIKIGPIAEAPFRVNMRRVTPENNVPTNPESLPTHFPHSSSLMKRDDSPVLPSYWETPEWFCFKYCRSDLYLESAYDSLAPYSSIQNVIILNQEYYRIPLKKKCVSPYLTKLLITNIFCRPVKIKLKLATFAIWWQSFNVFFVLSESEVEVLWCGETGLGYLSREAQSL
jgi:hypothetical protein